MRRVPGTSRSSRAWAGLAAAAAAGALLLVLPSFLSPFDLYVATEVFIFSLLSVSLNLLMGYGGMVSFGHSAYFGVGAYAVALLMKRAGWPMASALIAAPLLAALFALVFGYFCVRLTRIYFAMLTLAFSQVVYTVVFQWYDLTAGDSGITGVWPEGDLAFPDRFYYFALAIVAGSLWLLYRITQSPFGQTLQAIRENPRRARLIGLPIKRYQLAAFVIAGFFAGIAGALYALEKAGVYPTYLTVQRSLEPIIMILLGGMRQFLGPVLGAFAFHVLNTALTRYTTYWPTVLGVILVATILLFPHGLLGFVARRQEAQMESAAQKPVPAARAPGHGEGEEAQA